MSAAGLPQARALFANNPERRTAMSELLNAEPTASSRGLRLANNVPVREVIEQELESRELGITFRPWPGA
jgi:hypothetical protein